MLARRRGVHGEARCLTTRLAVAALLVLASCAGEVDRAQQEARRAEASKLARANVATLQALHPGMSRSAVHAALVEYSLLPYGGWPPLSNPFQQMVVERPGAPPVEIEFYLTNPDPPCEEDRFARPDEPLVFVEDVLVGIGWPFVESSHPSWGKSKGWFYGLSRYCRHSKL